MRLRPPFRVRSAARWEDIFEPQIVFQEDLGKRELHGLMKKSCHNDFRLTTVDLLVIVHLLHLSIHLIIIIKSPTVGDAAFLTALLTIFIAAFIVAVISIPPVPRLNLCESAELL